MATHEALAKEIADTLRPLAPEGKLVQVDVELINALAASFIGRVAQDHQLTAPAAFWTTVRTLGIFGRTIEQSEVDGTNAILKACAPLCLADTAYVLATTYHETDGTMKPIDEYGTDAYFFRMYDKDGARPGVAKRLGNTQRGDGVRFHGRGYPQLTGRANYKRAGDKVGQDLIANPDLAKRPDISAQILVAGMTEGWFTTRKLPDDLPRSGPATLEQFKASRDIINGTDRALKIAEEAMDFQTALIKGQWQ